MRIGIYVGSFNPPHYGHLEVCKYLLENDYVDQVLMLPTPNYWAKNNLVSVEDRVNMLKFYEDKKIKVDSIHNEFPYTYQVFRSLKNDYPNDNLYLIIGSDSLEKLHLWKNIDEIMQNKVLVLKRGEIIPNIHLDKYKDQIIYLNDFNYIDISSTEIRNGNKKNIHPDVLKYIEEHHLYEE